MPAHGKRYGEARRLVQQGERTALEEALQLVKKTATAKFDESVDIAVRLGVNPRQADQMIRGALSLPHGIGKDIKVIVFAEGEAARAAEEDTPPPWDRRRTVALATISTLAKVATSWGRV